MERPPRRLRVRFREGRSCGAGPVEDGPEQFALGRVEFGGGGQVGLGIGDAVELLEGDSGLEAVSGAGDPLQRLVRRGDAPARIGPLDLAVGKTLEDAVHQGREALAFHIEGLSEDGAQLPSLWSIDAIKGDSELAGWRDGADLVLI